MIFAEESHTDGSGLKVGFSVPKKNFKRAVHRNLLKRRMKEAFRLNKDLIPVSGKSFSVFLIFTASEIISFQIIEKAVKNCLQQLKKHS